MALRQLALVPVALLGRGLVVQPLLDLPRAPGPVGLERSDGRAPRLPLAQHAICQGARARAFGHVLRHQAAHVGDQGVHAPPDREHRVERLARQRVALLAPVVLRGLGLHGALVGAEFLVEQAAAVESMLAQHALAPGVDGVHGRVVHALCGQCQAPGGLGARRTLGVAGQQLRQEAVAVGHGGLAPEAPGGFEQARADAVGQLARGGAREGHHQDLGRAQRAGKAVLGAMAEHQAQVERGDGPGLAGAGAGLDEAATPEREVDGVQRGGLGRAHADTSGAGAAVSGPPPGCACTRTCSVAQSASGPQTPWARASKRPSADSASKSG